MKETYLPVSPLVAPTTVNRSLSSPFLPSFLLFKKNSNKFPNNCNATSLNANVGPWNSSSTKRSSSIFTSGVTSGWRNDEYERSMRSLSSAREISDGEIYSERTANESSWKEYSAQSDSQFVGSFGMCVGIKSPPSGARPVRTVCETHSS